MRILYISFGSIFDHQKEILNRSTHKVDVIQSPASVPSTYLDAWRLDHMTKRLAIFQTPGANLRCIRQGLTIPPTTLICIDIVYEWSFCHIKMQRKAGTLNYSNSKAVSMRSFCILLSWRYNRFSLLNLINVYLFFYLKPASMHWIYFANFY